MFFHTLGVSGSIGSGKSVRATHICSLVSRWFGRTVQERSNHNEDLLTNTTCQGTLSRPPFCIHTKLINADKEAHRLYSPGTPCYYEILKAFGTGILQTEDQPILNSEIPAHNLHEFEDDEHKKRESNRNSVSESKNNLLSSSSMLFSSTLPEINRKALGKIVFSDSKELGKLNLICRKRVEETLLNSISSAKEESQKLISESKSNYGGVFIVIEAALLQNLPSVVQQCNDIWLLHCDRDIAIERVVKRDKTDVSQAVNRVKSQKTTDDILRDLEKLSFGGEILRVDTSKGTVEEGLADITKVFHRYWERRVNKSLLSLCKQIDLSGNTKKEI